MELRKRSHRDPRALLDRDLKDEIVDLTIGCDGLSGGGLAINDDLHEPRSPLDRFIEMRTVQCDGVTHIPFPIGRYEKTLRDGSWGFGRESDLGV